MRRIVVHTALIASGARVLEGCGIADIRSPVPKFMRGKAVEPPPHHEPNGSGWTACVRAELTSVTGRPLGAETYRITISNGVIVDRRRTEADDNCASESYEAI